MKDFIILLCCISFLSFTQSSPDLTFLYQSWTLSQYKNDNGTPKLTYKSTKEIGNRYGFQFRKDGTLSVSLSVGQYYCEHENIFEVVEGKWKISEDSIFEVLFTSNGYSYHHAYVLKQLNARELVLRKQD
jgi:hypothetical protein